MATNNEIASELRALADEADDDLAQNDLNTLAEALSGEKRYLADELLYAPRSGQFGVEFDDAKYVDPDGAPSGWVMPKANNVEETKWAWHTVEVDARPSGSIVEAYETERYGPDHGITTQEDILAWCRSQGISAHMSKSNYHPKYGGDGVYVDDFDTDTFLETKPDGWKLVDTEGRERDGVWRNFPVYDP